MLLEFCVELIISASTIGQDKVKSIRANTTYHVLSSYRQFVGVVIKSEAEGVAQVVDSLGNPLVIPMQYAVAVSSRLVSICRSPSSFFTVSNTVLTPERVPRGRGGKNQRLAMSHQQHLRRCGEPPFFPEHRRKLGGAARNKFRKIKKNIHKTLSPASGDKSVHKIVLPAKYRTFLYL